MDLYHLFQEPDHVVCFGKHEGKTFREVAILDRCYTKWLIEKYAARYLAMWLRQFLIESEHGSIVVPFGKYKGLTFDQLLKKDKRYAVNFLADKLGSNYLKGNSHFFSLKYQPSDIWNHFSKNLNLDLVRYIDGFTYSRFKDLTPIEIIQENVHQR